MYFELGQGLNVKVLVIKQIRPSRTITCNYSCKGREKKKTFLMGNHSIRLHKILRGDTGWLLRKIQYLLATSTCTPTYVMCLRNPHPSCKFTQGAAGTSREPAATSSLFWPAGGVVRYRTRPALSHLESSPTDARESSSISSTMDLHLGGGGRGNTCRQMDGYTALH